ncbi:putative NADH-ubiquinone oxidoreductase [Pseudovirgaria hyperparasitica]|uniref:Putative NADH-ubiquinone oxidoreductase n=1 Tax=Pseudovirgaria hyperparasitica TaxID=470096 RepID=A0A6A6VW80_9PEZI|nr:putative NADH-ubiquinone oxidoreductase [Pseudovirgaria hyperparasitica]KAF2753900.1 putative NADH-ubiquinone oxidoreductase [Pseudovirgaria hyperparasitica]
MASLRAVLGRRLPSNTPRFVLARPYSSSSTPSTENPVPASDPKAQGKERHVSPVSKTNETKTSPIGSHDGALQETTEQGEYLRVTQAPNRQSPNRSTGIWSPSQQPRAVAMSGPRFEQTIMSDQPRPYAAIELIHKQPVRWTKERIVSCDGGGGPLGHPRIFINVDKPQVCWCTYCGLPYAHEKHRAYLETLPSTPYPLDPQGTAAEVSPKQRVTDEVLGQR